MFDIGWPELLLVAVLLLIVVGPKDLPIVLRTMGRYVGKMRAMGREFTQTLEEVAREAELDDVVQAAQKARPANLKTEIERFLDEETTPSASTAHSTSSAPTSAAPLTKATIIETKDDPTA